MGQGSSSTRSRPFDDEGYIAPTGNAASAATEVLSWPACSATSQQLLSGMILCSQHELTLLLLLLHMQVQLNQGSQSHLGQQVASQEPQ
jgi:hypothetical protein